MSKIYNNLSIETLIKTAWFNQFDKNQKYERNRSRLRCFSLFLFKV